MLCLGFVGEDCKKVHVVKNGDSCPTIASQANITSGELLTDNPNVNAACTNIYEGEVSIEQRAFFSLLTKNNETNH